MKFETPKLEIISFHSKDILTASKDVDPSESPLTWLDDFMDGCKVVLSSSDSFIPDCL